MGHGSTGRGGGAEAQPAHLGGEDVGEGRTKTDMWCIGKLCAWKMHHGKGTRRGANLVTNSKTSESSMHDTKNPSSIEEEEEKQTF